VQYNFQAISIALLVMSASVCTSNDDSCKEGEQSAWVSSTATATVFVGAITGQLSVSYRVLLIGVRFLPCFASIFVDGLRW